MLPLLQRRSGVQTSRFLIAAPAGSHRLGCALAAVLLLAVGCGDHGATFNQDPILQPPRFEQLEPAIRQQFTRLRDQLARARTSSRQSSPRALGQAWGDLGQWFHVYRYPQSAMRCYAEAVLLDPEEPRWQYYLGILAVESGELDQAAAAFASAARLAPDSPSILVRQAELMLQQRKPGRAQTHFRQALALDPHHLSAAIGLARLLLQAGKPQQALEVLLALPTPDNRYEGHINYLQAQAQRLLGRHDEARRLLERIPEGNSEPPALGGDDPWLDQLMANNLSSNHLTRLGMRAYRQGDFRRAALHAGRASTLNPDNAELRTNYAAALLALGRTREALEQVERSLEQQPGLARAHLVRAGALRQTGKLTMARDALLAALDLDPDMRDARQQLGRIYQQTGRVDQAIEQYAEMRERHPESMEVRFWHAALLASENRFGEALDALEEDLATHPRSRTLQLIRIRILAAADDVSRQPRLARALLSEVIDARADVYYAETAAMVAAALGNFGEAETWQSIALEAVETLADADKAHIVRRRLTLYREKKPCRTPWEPQEALITKPVTRPEGMNKEA